MSELTPYGFMHYNNGMPFTYLNHRKMIGNIHHDLYSLKVRYLPCLAVQSSSIAGTVPSLQPFKSIIVWRSQRFQLRLRLQLKPGSDEQFEFSSCLSLALSTLQSPPLSLQPSAILPTPSPYVLTKQQF